MAFHESECSVWFRNAVISEGYLTKRFQKLGTEDSSASKTFMVCLRSWAVS